MINQTRRFLPHHRQQQIFINVPQWKARFQPRLRIFIAFIVIRQIADFLDVVILVSASEHDERGVMPEASHVAACFCFHGSEEGWESRVGTAGEEEVLPNDDAELVAGVAK
jgi:hypothetical protein